MTANHCQWVTHSRKRLAAALLGMLICAPFAYASNDEPEHTAKNVGHAIGSAARQIGKGAKQAGKAVGREAKKAGKAVGRAAKAGGQQFNCAVKDRC